MATGFPMNQTLIQMVTVGTMITKCNVKPMPVIQTADLTIQTTMAFVTAWMTTMVR